MYDKDILITIHIIILFIITQKSYNKRNKTYYCFYTFYYHSKIIFYRKEK